MGDDPNNKLEFPKDAYNNEQGLYTVPDPERSKGDFVQDVNGLFIPAPPNRTLKRAIWTDGNFKYEVAETAEEIIAMLENVSDGEWLTFTDPVFGNPIRMPWHAATRVVAIAEEYQDLDEIKVQIEQQETQKRLMAIESGRGKQQAQRIIRNNHR
jgi:hypothetical protein